MTKLLVNQSPLSRNTLTLLVSNGGSAALSFVLTALIGRALGEGGLGVYATVLAWVFPLSLMVEFGLGTLITRDVAQHPDSAPAYLRAVAVARLLIGGSVMLLLLLAAPLISANPDVVTGLRIAAPMVVILPFFSAFTALFRAHHAMWPIPPLNIGMLVAQVALTALVFASGGGVKGALIVNTTTSAGQLAVAWGIYRWRFYRPSTQATRTVSPAMVTPLLRRAWPFALAAFFAALQTRVGIIMLEQLADTADAGLYAAASRFVEAARMIPNAFFGALFPMLATLAAKPQTMQRIFTRALRGLLLFGLAAGALTTLLAPLGMDIAFGGDFASATPALRILMWSLLPALLRGGRTLYWYAREREHYVNVVNALAVAVQIALGLWLIPRHGAVGAAGVALITEGAALALLWREIPLPALRTLSYEKH